MNCAFYPFFYDSLREFRNCFFLHFSPFYYDFDCFLSFLDACNLRAKYWLLFHRRRRSNNSVEILWGYAHRSKSFRLCCNVFHEKTTEFSKQQLAISTDLQPGFYSTKWLSYITNEHRMPFAFFLVVLVVKRCTLSSDIFTDLYTLVIEKELPQDVADP